MLVERQTVWGWLPFVHIFVGGTGASAYITMITLSFFRPGVLENPLLWVVIATAVGCVVAGLTSVAIDAGRRSRAPNVYLNIRRSWMSRVALMATLFIAFSLSSLVFGNSYLMLAAYAAALIYITGQGFMLSASKKIPAWNTPVTPPLIACSSLVAGASLFTIAALSLGYVSVLILEWPLALLHVLVILVGLGYLAWPGATLPFKKALKMDGNRVFFLLALLIGDAAPILLTLAPPLYLAAPVLGALLSVAGSGFLKYVLMLRLSYKLSVIQLPEPSYLLLSR